MTLMFGANSSAVKKLSTNVVKCIPFASRTRPSAPIVNLVLSDIKFVPFCSFQRGSIDPAGSRAACRIAKPMTLPAIHTTKTRKGALLLPRATRPGNRPASLSGASNTTQASAAVCVASSDTANFAPPSNGVAATASDRITAPIGLGPRIACCVAVLRRRSISIPPAPFFSSVA